MLYIKDRMENYQKYLREASRTFKIADHMISVTYPLVKDTKLLLAILENIHITLQSCVSALVYHDRYFKRLPPFQETFESKFNMFRMKCVPNYNIKKSHIELIQTIQSLIKEHKSSPIEFIRKDKFVICSDHYNIKTLSLKDIREYISQTKYFMDNIQEIITKNERITM